jgi:hypothetical protein
MSLSRRLDQLEILVQAQAPDSDLQPIDPAWDAAFGEAMERLLGTMPAEYARRVTAAIEAGAWLDDPIAFRAVDLVLSSIPPAQPRWWPWEVRGWITCRSPLVGSLALPGATCELIEAHPNTEFQLFDCAACGYRPGERPSSEWLPGWRAAGSVGHALRTFVTTCPLCSGPVGWCFYEHSRSRCVQALQEPAWAVKHGIRCPHPEPCRLPSEQRIHAPA